MAFRVGKDGRVKLGSSTFVKVRKWKVDPQADMFDVTNSESGTPVEEQSGHIKYTVTIELHWEASNSPIALFGPGATVSDVRLYVDGASATIAWYFSSLVVSGTPNEVEARGMNTVTVTGTGFGAVTHPTGG